MKPQARRKACIIDPETKPGNPAPLAVSGDVGGRNRRSLGPQGKKHPKLESRLSPCKETLKGALKGTHRSSCRGSFKSSFGGSFAFWVEGFRV